MDFIDHIIEAFGGCSHKNQQWKYEEIIEAEALHIGRRLIRLYGYRCQRCQHYEPAGTLVNRKLTAQEHSEALRTGRTPERQTCTGLSKAMASMRRGSLSWLAFWTGLNFPTPSSRSSRSSVRTPALSSPSSIPRVQPLSWARPALSAMLKLRVGRPGAWLNDSFDFRVWKQHYGQHLLNADAMVTTFSEVQPRRSRFFIRPCLDNKVFAGMLTDWPDFESWRQRVRSVEGWRQIPDDTPVVVGDIKPIQAEYRTVVVNGRVITASLYKQGTRVFYSDVVGPGVYDFAQKMADIWCPAQAFVLDVFMCEGQFFVGEINCFNAAGFYALNVGKMVEAIEALEYR